MFRWARLLMVGISTASLVMAAALAPVAGSTQACSGQFSVNSFPPNSQSGTYLQVNNNGSDPITWVKVIVNDTQDYSIVGASSNDWNALPTSTDVTFTGSSINPATAYGNFLIQVQAGPNEAPASTWTVEASNDSGGANPYTCSDDGLGTSVNDGNAPVISNVAVSVQTTDATVTWTTDKQASSKVNYGTTSQYGSSSPTDSNLTTDHSVTLSGLKPGTSYHYQIDSVDVAGNEALSGDNTFLTGAVSVVGKSSGNQLQTAIASSKIPIVISANSEKIPPTITLTSTFAKVQKTPPKVTGTATDNVAVARVDYSTDGGKNWLPADSAPGLGTPQTSFSFTPQNLDDGDYSLLARAIDTSGNIATTPAQPLVIDRLPPEVGGNIIAIGPQVLKPDADGVIHTLTKIDQKFTTNAIGGATSIILVAVDSKGTPSQHFALTESPDSGLWQGVLSFAKAGIYRLRADSIDGAGNHTSRVVDNVTVVSPGQATADGHGVARADLTLYYLEPSSQAWTVWDGASYGQQNPQIADKDGRFSLFVPPGRYYLQAKAPGYQTLLSDIFDVDKPTPLVSVLHMKHSLGLHVGSFRLTLPLFSSSQIGLSQAKTTVGTGINLAGQPIPSFTLPSSSGGSVNSITFAGKPTLVTLLSSWSPISKEQLSGLAAAQRNQAVNIVPVSEQEGLGRLTAINELGGYNLNFLADPDGTLVGPFGVSSLPAHYFLDRHGVVKKVIIGVLSSDQILNTLASN